MLKPFINKIKLKRMTNIWDITDQVIKVKDITENAIPDFASRYKLEGSFTCMRDMELNTTSIFIRGNDVEKLKNIKMIYDKDGDYINLSILKKFILFKDAYHVIANKIVPPAVNIKMLYYCNIMDVNLYIQTTYRLQQDATLFKELLNMENLKTNNSLINLRNKGE